MEFLPKDNKIIKRLNDINQDAKLVFGDLYYIDSESNLFTDPKSPNRPTIGKHYAHIDSEFKIFTYDIASVNSKNIYRCLKHIKKSDIEGLSLDSDGVLRFVLNVPEEKLLITENKKSIRIDTEIMRAVDVNIDPPCALLPVGFITLDDDVVESLVKNKTYIVRDDKYSCRITKSVIPGLKKSHKVFASLRESTDPSILLLRFIVNRATMVTYHEYKVFNIN